MRAIGVPCRLPAHSLMSCSVPLCTPPSCTSTTMASMPAARSCGTRAFTVAASSRNSSPATPVGTTIAGVSFSVMPMKATGTPWKRFTP